LGLLLTEIPEDKILKDNCAVIGSNRKFSMGARLAIPNSNDYLKDKGRLRPWPIIQWERKN
jgi:hypothetical protein